MAKETETKVAITHKGKSAPLYSDEGKSMVTEQAKEILEDFVGDALEFNGVPVTCDDGDLELLRNLIDGAANYALDKVGLKRYKIPDTDEIETRMVISVITTLNDRVQQLFNLPTSFEGLDRNKGIPLNTVTMGFEGLIDIGLWVADNMNSIFLGAGYLSEAKIKEDMLILRFSLIDFNWITFGRLWNHVPQAITVGLWERQEKMF